MTLNSQQNTANGNNGSSWATQHGGWQQTDQVRVWTEAPLLSLSLFILSSIVQSSRGKKEEHVRPKRPEMFKAKAHTGLTQDQEQQLWTFYPAQQGAWGVCWGGCFHCRLNFYIHIYHSSSFGNKQVSKTCGEMRYNSWHLRYGTSTVLLHVNSKACERTHTHTHARKNTHTRDEWGEKFMAKVGEAACKGTLSHTSLCPSTLK